MTPRSIHTSYAVTNNREHTGRLHQHLTHDHMKTLCGHHVAESYETPRTDLANCKSCQRLDTQKPHPSRH